MVDGTHKSLFFNTGLVADRKRLIPASYFRFLTRRVFNLNVENFNLNVELFNLEVEIAIAAYA